MKVILDTNVIVSGILFTGLPAKLLAAWREGRFSLVVTPMILAEYHRVASELSKDFPKIDIVSVLDVIAIHAEIASDPEITTPLCRDPDDDKFLAIAAVIGAILVSGDKDLITADGTLGVRVLTPRTFATDFLK